jgi:surface antigen
VHEKVHGKPVGTTAKWDNPESQNSGRITLLKKFTRNGQQCETLDYRLRTIRKAAGPEHYALSSCLQSDGQRRLI